MSTQWGIPSIVSHNWTAIDSSIRSNQLPVISLRWPKITNIKGGFHYRTVVGTRKAVKSLEMKLIWWTVTINLSSEGQYLMHDNGSDGVYMGNWWEGSSLYHFQAASVVKK